jgi:hypothetical protein
MTAAMVACVEAVIGYCGKKMAALCRAMQA